MRAHRRPASTDALDAYLPEIRGTDLLAAHEERDLAAAIAAGDESARARMIRANFRLVARIARDDTGQGPALDDLIGEGNLGLIRASEESDPASGVRSSPHAGYGIKQSIRHALMNTEPVIRLPAHMVTLQARWRKAERALTRELGRAPGRGRVAAELALTGSQLATVEWASRAGSLLHEEGGDGADGSRAPQDHSGHEPPPGVGAEAGDDRRDLRERLGRLDARERAVVALRFGPEGGEPLTHKEIGRRLGVPRERARKLEKRASHDLGASAPPPRGLAAVGASRPRPGLCGRRSRPPRRPPASP